MDQKELKDELLKAVDEGEENGSFMEEKEEKKKAEEAKKAAEARLAKADGWDATARAQAALAAAIAELKTLDYIRAQRHK